MEVAVVLGGCAPQEDPPLPPVVWEGEAVRVRMDDPGIQVCGGSFEALDRHAQLVREALLLQGDGIIDYSIGDEDFVDQACNLESPIACTNGTDGRVFTAVPFNAHEIVHAVRREDPEIGLLSSPFEEGLAMVYGDDILPSWPIPLEILELFEAPVPVPGEQEYYYSGHMMAKLLEFAGVATFRQFDIEARSVGEDEAFVGTFGETKEDFAAFAEEDPVCEQTQWWVPLLECDGEPMTPDPETGGVTLTGNIECGESDVRGPDARGMWTSRYFRLDERTSHLSYQFDMPEDATLEIVACNGGCPDRFAYIGTRNQVGSIVNGLPALEPGEYFLRMSRPVVSNGEDGRFEIVLE